MASTLSAIWSTLTVTLRPFMIGLLVLLFLIPLSMVSSVIRDRIDNQSQAIESISSSWAREQNVLGPILIVPVSEMKPEEQYNTETKKVTIVQNRVETTAFFIPDKLDVVIEWSTEERRRGIYNVPVYNAQIRLSGSFDDLAGALNDYQKQGKTTGEPYLVISISDIRGISASSRIMLGGEPHDIEPGSKISALPGGFHIPLTAETLRKGGIEFDMEFGLKGINSFNMVPAGGTVTMEGRADWPHPSFNGQFLPDSKDITEEGFQATWKTGLLATNLLDQLSPCIGGAKQSCDQIVRNSFGVSFFQPVNIYTQSLRSVKYGILFVALTFAVFYINEILRGTRVYAMQLILVGLALAIFYLLLLSLAELMGFTLAYLLASTATISLLTYYSCFVLKDKKRGLIVGGIITLLYVVLYFNLSSEDYALLIGSIVLFLALAVTMFVTRNVNWAALQTPSKETEE